MFRNQLICRGDFGFCCDILVLCLSWPLVIKTCYDNFVNRQNEVWFIQGLYPFSYTILLKRAFNQFNTVRSINSYWPMNYLFYVGCGEIHSTVAMWSEEERHEKWKLVLCWWREGKVKNGFGKGGGCRERLDNMFLLCSHWGRTSPLDCWELWRSVCPVSRPEQKPTETTLCMWVK